MALQAFIDDSYSANGEFVLGGHIATAESWVSFTEKWQALLPTGGTLAANGVYHFKMSEMASNPGRMERIPAFWWIIPEHVSVSLSCRINVAELNRARSRIYVPTAQLEWGFWKSPYLVAVRCLLDMFHNNRDKISNFIPLEERVDFVFDEQITEKRVIYESWAPYMASRSENIRRLYGDRPRFENDQKLLPLQAPDFWAWWVRRWSESGDVHQKMHQLDFGSWNDSGGKHYKGTIFHITFNEDQLVKSMIEATREMLGPRPVIYDVRFSSPIV